MGGKDRVIRNPGMGGKDRVIRNPGMELIFKITNYSKSNG
jgi:hypothetical protein